MNLSISFLSFGKAHFAITSNPLNDSLEIEGANSFFISNDWKKISENSWWFLPFVKIIKSIPFLSPLKVLDQKEYTEIKLAFKNDAFRFYKQLQKFNLILLAIRKNNVSSNRSKSLIRLICSMGIERNKFSFEHPWLSINNRMEKIAQNFFHTMKLDTSSLPQNSRALYVNESMQLSMNFKFTQVPSNGIELSSAALVFWSRVFPNTFARETRMWLKRFHSPELDKIQSENKRLDKLLRLSELRANPSLYHLYDDQSHDELQDDATDLFAQNIEDRPFCIRPFRDLHVTCEGDAYMCCFTERPKGKVGNLIDSSIDDVWNSQILREARETILSGELPQICRESIGCPHHFDPLHPGKVKKPLLQPQYIELNLPNTHCNIGGNSPSKESPACIMCERDLEGFKPEDDSNFDHVLNTIREALPSLKIIHIQGIAEPFWQDAIFKVLDTINYDHYKENVRISLTTNAVVFTPKKQIELLNRCGLLNINFSIDATTSETYKKIRRLDVFETVLANIRHWGELRKQNPNIFCRIQNNINAINVHEVVGMVKFAAEVGVDQLELNPTAGFFDFVVNLDNAHLFAEAQRLAKEEADKLGVDLVFLRPLDLDLAARS